MAKVKMAASDNKEAHSQFMDDRQSPKKKRKQSVEQPQGHSQQRKKLIPLPSKLRQKQPQVHMLMPRQHDGPARAPAGPEHLANSHKRPAVELSVEECSPTEKKLRSMLKRLSTHPDPERKARLLARLETLAEQLPSQEALQEHDGEDAASQLQQLQSERRAKEKRLAALLQRCDAPAGSAKKVALQQRVAGLVGELELLGDEITALQGNHTAASASRPPTYDPQPKRVRSLTWVRSTAPGAAPGEGFRLKETPRSADSITRTALGPQEAALRKQRKQRFAAQAGTGAEGEEEEKLLDARQSGSYGNLETLEKEYLRLTSLPLASNVRPPHVLEQALELVKSRWLAGPDYSYACEQLKSIRQDLTVQHVRGGLARSAYEVHARIALEMDDMAEFKQCHSVLMQLYAEADPAEAKNEDEFVAYGLLYAASLGALPLAGALHGVSSRLLVQPGVMHALLVCNAYRLGNCVALLRLYESAPRMSPYLMDPLLERLRACMLRFAITAYHPTAVPLSALAQQLGFGTLLEVADFCRQKGAVLDSSGEKLDTRSSRARAAGPPRPPQ